MSIFLSRIVPSMALFAAVITLKAGAAELRPLWQQQVSSRPAVDLRLSLTADGQALRVADGSKILQFAMGDGTLLGPITPPLDITQPSGDRFDIEVVGYQADSYLYVGARFPNSQPRIGKWSPATGAMVHWEANAPGGAVLNNVAVFLPTGGIATASYAQPKLRLHDPETLVPIADVALREGSQVHQVLFSPSGEFVLAVGDDYYGVLVWRPASPSRMFLLHPPDDYVLNHASLARINSLAVSREGLVAYGGLTGFLSDLTFYDVPGVVFVHRLPGGEVVHALAGHGHPVGPVAFVGEGDVLMSMDGVTVRFWHMGDGRQLLVLTGPAMGYPAQFANGSLLVASDTTWFAVHGPDKGQVTQYRMPLLLTHSSVVGEQLEVRWVGGSGRYQVQRSPSPDGAWENTGEVFSERVATLPTTPERGFFRVVSVGE